MPFIPHTKDDIQEMLAAIGVKSIQELFDEIPKELCTKELTGIPSGLTEMEAARLLQERAELDQRKLCFIGAGAYEHHIPAAVWEIASRGEFMTAYTPYQAEASQGTLQLLYEYQTMMASLTGMDVSNASMYDGATALAEAVLMAVRANRQSKSRRILMAGTINPSYRKVIQTIVKNQQIELIEIDYCTKSGYIVPESLAAYHQQDIAALVIAQPNFFGVLEEVDQLTDWAHQHSALAIAAVNPASLSLLKPPGKWGQRGADIACGEGQPLGVPLASGGPYFGFLTCKQDLVRQMPGRIVGRTIDLEGKPGFTLTLQAREQHIRRAKATSNICTNQGLLVTAATIYMSLVGPTGLRRVATESHANTADLKKQLSTIKGIEILFNRPFFHEIVIKCPLPVQRIINELTKVGIQAGFNLKQNYPELGECLLVCATETKTPADLQYFVESLARIIHADETHKQKQNELA